MRLPPALACLAATLVASASCFNPALDCRLICQSSSDCPGDLTCQAGLCARKGEVCESPDAGGSDASSTDSSPEKGAPRSRICDRSGARCIDLVPAVSAGLVLWLDPSSLPGPQQTVDTWPDQSGQGNDAHPGNEAFPPVVLDGAAMFTEDAPGAGLVVSPNPSLDFAADDFLILVVAGIRQGTPTALYMKSDGSRSGRQTSLLWLPLPDDSGFAPQGLVNFSVVTPESPPLVGGRALFGMRRVGSRLELRVDGAVIATTTLADASASTNSESPLYLGTLGSLGLPTVDLEAAVAVKGALADEDVAALEGYLTSFRTPP